MAELWRKHRLSDMVVCLWKQQLFKQAHCIERIADGDVYPQKTETEQRC